jgi:bacillithiol biosynthesis cysteine-adding enzyme BshC
MHTSVSLLQLPIVPRLIHDYLSGNPSLKPFYHYFPSIENFQMQIEEKRRSYRHRSIIADALQKQYQRLKTTAQTKRHIELLQSDHTFTVTTAHQPHIFSGPAYFIYKIAHAIRLSQVLQLHYPAYHFVPVYFMGCEDHDFEEINHIHLHGKTIEWKNYQGGAIGRYDVQGLLPLVNTIKQLLDDKPHTAEILKIFETGYGQHATLAEATRYIVNELFGHYGLVVINPDDKQLKQLFVPIILEEITEGSVYKNAIATIGKLEKLHYKMQAQPRAINLFFLDRHLRARIVFNENTHQYEVLNTSWSFTKDEIARLAEVAPEKFSPNVFLRPLYQELLLPNLAYVGGTGELSYWLEQQGIFKHFQIPYPILVLRNSFTLIDATDQKKLQKLNIRIEQLFEDENHIIKQYLLQNDTLPDFQAEKESFQKTFEAIKNKTIAIDPTLGPAVGAQLHAAIKSIEQIEKKAIRAAKQKQEIALNQIKSLRSKIMPSNILQERYETGLLYYARLGLSFNDWLLQTIEPLEARMHFLTI